MRKGALYSLFQAFKERKGTRRAVVAMAHHLVKIIYCLFTKGGNFEAQSTDALTKVRKQKYLSAGDCHEFCVHGIIGARYTGTPHEHNYQETNLS